MNDGEHTDRHDEDPSQGARSQGPGSEGSGSQESQRPAAPQPREIHRERETIVTGGGRRSGSSTAIVVISALVVLGIVAFIAITFFGGVGVTILPGEDGVDIETPQIEAPELDDAP